MSRKLLVALASLVLASCVDTYRPQSLGLDHPANPDAVEAPTESPLDTLNLHNTPTTQPAMQPAADDHHHGPTFEAVEGDRVRIYVTNKLSAPTSVHWHGVYLPNGMDGVGGLNQRAIQPGETFKYEWTWRQHGTFMYHSHHDEMTQMGMGLMGMIVVHPRKPSAGYKVDRDFAIMLSEWAIKPGTEPLVAKLGDRVRIRIGNLSAMDHHPIHLHGHKFHIVATDGDQIPVSAQWPATTVLMPVGSTRDVEFIADAPGDWAMHCHMTHHVMNQMGHGIPNMVGMKPGNLDHKVRSLLPAYMTMGQHGMGDMGEMGMPVPKNSIPMVGARGPFDYITMGGMFTIVKTRENLTNYDYPGWYEHPPGTVADLATHDELQRDLRTSPVRAAPARNPEMLYICPMHPNVVSDKTGNCPKCFMKLKPKQ